MTQYVDPSVCFVPWTLVYRAVDWSMEPRRAGQGLEQGQINPSPFFWAVDGTEQCQKDTPTHPYSFLDIPNTTSRALVITSYYAPATGPRNVLGRSQGVLALPLPPIPV